jgi:hypothetical protein
LTLALWGFLNEMGLKQVNRTGKFAKIMMLFFALLFTAVLIHPDMDLLDVHDVKITSVRTQFRSPETQLLQRAPILLTPPASSQTTVLERLCFADETVSSCELAASSILRI